MTQRVVYIGIDVSERRDCAFAAIDANARWIGGGIVAPVRAVDWVRNIAGDARVVMGIDAPRVSLPSARLWQPGASRWNRVERGLCGRHAELVLKRLRLANPQWTPLEADAPGWMRIGFALFRDLEPLGRVHEVFPTASKRQLVESPIAEPIDIDLRAFATHANDMLDALVGAVTVRAFDLGIGFEVGGGDGLGTIVLPRRCSLQPEFLRAWPSAAPSD